MVSSSPGVRIRDLCSFCSAISAGPFLHSLTLTVLIIVLITVPRSHLLGLIEWNCSSLAYCLFTTVRCLLAAFTLCNVSPMPLHWPLHCLIAASSLPHRSLFTASSPIHRLSAGHVSSTQETATRMRLPHTHTHTHTHTLHTFMFTSFTVVAPVWREEGASF
jgi:hypothetical protein